MRVYLSLGSNLGGRKANLDQAIERLRALPGIRLAAVSDYIETEPVGPPDQPWFVNAAAAIETGLKPRDLLAALKHIENAMGRKPAERWGPRLIDIDIILWGEQTIAEEGLEVPHPEFRQRAFVLEPLAQIAPGARDPQTGQTVTELAAANRASRAACAS